MRTKQKKYNEVKLLFGYHEWEYGHQGDPCIVKTYSKQLVELGCGYAEHALSWLQNNSTGIAWGVDIKGDRLYSALQVFKEGQTNFRVLRADVSSCQDWCEPASVDILWVTFPDPFDSKPTKCIAHPEWLGKYFGLLKTEGALALVTDRPDIAEWWDMQILGWKRVKYPFGLIESRYHKSKSVEGRVYTRALKKTNL